MEPWLVSTLILAAYMLLTLILGWVAGRKLEVDVEDFFLYGRKAGFLVLYLAVVATYHSAFAFLGAPAYFYRHGLGFLDAGCWTLLVGILTVIYAPRIHKLGKAFRCLTPADLFAAYFRHPAVRPVIALLCMVFSVFYIQVQSMGLGYILHSISGARISYPLAVGLLLGVAAVYVMTGGLRAVYWTDVLQGVWMYVAVWLGAAYILFARFDSLGEFWRTVAAKSPAHLTLPGPENFFSYPMWFSFLIIFSMGVFLQPHIFIRFYTARSSGMLKRLGATTPLYLTSLYIPICFVGLAGVVLVDQLSVPPASADQIFPALLTELAPVWLTGLVLAGAAAASMSTMDAILHVNSLVFTQDIYQHYIAPGRTGAHYIAVGRAVIFVLLVISFFLSVFEPKFLVHLVALSSSGALLLWPGLQEILFPGSLRLGPRALLAGIVAGLLALLVALFWGLTPLGFHAGIWATIINFSVAVGAARLWHEGGAELARPFRDALREEA
ncbi:MAG: sodium:solute symporter family protein [Acidobacteria bacterium]|nr:sodium:solute symporter family protein [Acidobacteriota bacterium]